MVIGLISPIISINQLKLTIMDKKFEKIYEIAEREEKQYVYEVFECDACHRTSSMEHKATCNSLEEAVDMIMEHGCFDECSDKDYIRYCLTSYLQTQGEDVNYIISKVDVGVWE